jgi:hypothetical protein
MPRIADGSTDQIRVVSSADRGNAREFSRQKQLRRKSFIFRAARK